MVSKSTSKSPVSDGQVKKRRQSGIQKRGSVSSDGMADQLTKSVDPILDDVSSNSDVSDHQEKSTNGQGKNSGHNGIEVKEFSCIEHE